MRIIKGVPGPGTLSILRIADSTVPDLSKIKAPLRMYQQQQAETLNYYQQRLAQMPTTGEGRFVLRKRAG